MSAAALALHDALRDLWLADASVQALVAGRIWGRVPREPDHPYVVLGAKQTIDADLDCAASVDVAIDVHVWSRTPGDDEAERIAAALRNSLRTAHRADTLAVAGFRMPTIRAASTRTFLDPDGLTTHAVVTIEAHLDPQ